MKNIVCPDKYYKRITEIDIIKDLKEQGIKALILDIDNTLLPRDAASVPQDIREWLCAAQDVGIEIILLSNNWHESIYVVAKNLDLELIAKAVKPLPFAFVRAIHKLRKRFESRGESFNREEVCMIGDQLVTDCIGARVVGVPIILLDPLSEKDLWHTLLLRRFEKLLFNKDAYRSNS